MRTRAPFVADGRARLESEALDLARAQAEAEFAGRIASAGFLRSLQLKWFRRQRALSLAREEESKGPDARLF
jgi:hypothetical protein